MNAVIQYVNDVKSKSIAEQVFASVYFDLAIQKITAKEAEAVLEHVKDIYIISTHPTTVNYLQTVLQRATPKRIETAKKTLKSYMSYLVYNDLKEAKISLEEAETAKVSIPDFLTKIRPANASK